MKFLLKRISFVLLLFFFELVLANHFPSSFFSTRVFAETNDNWVLGFSEFSLNGVPELYTSYSKIVPELLAYHLNTDIGYAVSISEKKARNLLTLTQKKLTLISELSKLYTEKDKLFLEPISEKEKTKKKEKIEKSIQEKLREIENVGYDIQIETLKADSTSMSETKLITQWKDGDLFNVPTNTSLAVALKNAGISGLVHGSIKDVSGYAIVNVKVETGLGETPEISISEAGKYEEIDTIIQTLAILLYAELQSLPKRTIIFEVNPPEAKLFVNTIQVTDYEETFSVYAPSITVFAVADGYESATRTFTFGKQNSYKLSIDLRKLETVPINVQADIQSDLFVQAEKVASISENPDEAFEVELYKQRNVLDFETEDGVRTFVVFDPEVNASLEELNVKLNKTSVRTKIERQRSVMYWSLAAVYFSLPVTLILNGVKNDKFAAYNSGRLPNTPENQRTLKALNISSGVMIGITAGLAVNYFVQVILYLIQADSALPSVAK